MIAGRKYIFTILLLSFLCAFITYGQEKEVIYSEPANILIQNNTIGISDNDYKSELHFSILFPIFNDKRTYVTDLSQINLIGKVNITEDIDQLFINNQPSLFSKDGLFFKVIDLSPGKNVLKLKVVLKTGKILIVNYFIELTKEKF